MTFVLDAMGSDLGPREITLGIAKAAKVRKDINFKIFGDGEIILKTLKEEGISLDRVEVYDCHEVMTNDDTPTDIIKLKSETSLGQAIRYLRSNDVDGLLTAGSTGATLSGATLLIGRIPGINRPCLMATLPTRTKKLTRVMDIGANMDCKPEYLYQFALMANVFLKSTGIENPRIGLLNVGKEDHKGNQLTHAVSDMLKANKDLNFVGNIEGDHVLKGEADAVICDGFAGNVFLKSLEESAYFISDAFKEALNKNIFTKFGALFQLKHLKNVKNLFKYANEACAPLLGIKKLVIKMHGKSNANNVKSCILQAAELVDNKFIDEINKIDVKGV